MKHLILGITRDLGKKRMKHNDCDAEINAQNAK
jgi:hypothetical protein